eukprot:4564115-Pyramimonas_sp.AAC.1
MPADSWSKRAMTWIDSAWWNTPSRGIVSCPIRLRPGRLVRWEDDRAIPEVWKDHEREGQLFFKR